MLDAINRVAKRHNGWIDKIAFAKALIELCSEPGTKLRPQVGEFLDRMRIVFRSVNEAVRLVTERVTLFKVDNPSFATREQANIALRQIESQLDDSPEAEAIRNAMVPLRRDYHLHEEPAARIDDFTAFLEDLDSLKHAWRAQQSAAKPVRSAAEKPSEKKAKPRRRSSPRKSSSKKAATEITAGANPPNPDSDEPTQAE